MMRQMDPESLKGMASLLQQYGRNGDTMLAHINPKEAMLLNNVTDGGSVNPMTGMPEFFNDDDSDEGDDDDAGGGMGTADAGAADGSQDTVGEPGEEGGGDDPFSDDATSSGEDLGNMVMLSGSTYGQKGYGVPSSKSSGIGGLFDSVSDYARSYVDNITPTSFGTNLVVNTNPFAAAANLASMVVTGKSLGRHLAEGFTSDDTVGTTVDDPLSETSVTDNDFSINTSIDAPDFSDFLGSGEPDPYIRVPQYASGGAVSLDALYNNVRARRGPITGGQRSGGGIMSLR